MTFQKTVRIASMAGAALLALSSVHAQTVLKIGYTPAATSHYGVGSTVLCDEIEKGTQGRYKCQQFPRMRRMAKPWTSITKKPVNGWTRCPP